jgi:oligogalacturonide lyase
VFATHVDTHNTEFIYKFSNDVIGSVTSLNADETLLGGALITKEENDIFKKNPKKSDYFNKIYESKLKRSLITINVSTKELNNIYSENAWLNHIQFSPTYPDLLMYCHEGPWHKVDRIWNINVKTRKTQLMHKRTVDREIAGHEFFSPDGKTIWFDLQIPRGETFYLAGKHLDTGEETRYTLKRDEWSIHFNIAPNMKTFAGDGGDEGQVAHAKNGRWIYHFTPKGDSLASEKLVNMKNHDYGLEPNVHFSPDGKQIIFRANFEGNTQIYAVDFQKRD